MTYSGISAIVSAFRHFLGVNMTKFQIILILCSVTAIGFAIGFGVPWLLEKIESALGAEQ